MASSMTLIFGGGGVAREVAWLLADCNPARSPDFFVVANRDWSSGNTIDGVPAIPDRDLEAAMSDQSRAYLAVGLPLVRRSLHEFLANHERIDFPDLIHASARMDTRTGRTMIGRGTIVYPLASLNTGVSIGDFVQINPNATIGHGTSVGDYTTICPGANISGNVEIGAGCFIGAGAVIKERVRIAAWSVIGAGAVVLNDISESGTWVGVPARKVGL